MEEYLRLDEVPTPTTLKISVLPVETNSLLKVASWKNLTLYPARELSDVSNTKSLLLITDNGGLTKDNSWLDPPVLLKFTSVGGKLTTS